MIEKLKAQLAEVALARLFSTKPTTVTALNGGGYATLADVFDVAPKTLLEIPLVGEGRVAEMRVAVMDVASQAGLSTQELAEHSALVREPVKRSQKANTEYARARRAAQRREAEAFVKERDAQFADAPVVYDANGARITVAKNEYAVNPRHAWRYTVNGRRGGFAATKEEAETRARRAVRFA